MIRDDQRPSPPVPWGLVLLGGALAAGSVAGASARPGPEVLVPLAAVLLLDLTAPRLPGFGFFSAASAGALAVALLPGGGLPAAAIGGALALLLRTLLRGRPEPGWKLREFLADGVPLFGGLVALRVSLLALPATPSLPPLGVPVLAFGAALVASLLLGATVASRLAEDLDPEERAPWEQVRERLYVLSACSLLAASALAQSTVVGGWTGLLVLPVLGGLQVGARQAVFRSRLERSHLLEQQALQAESTVHHAREELAAVRNELRKKLDESSVLETFGLRILHSESTAEVVQVALETLRRFFRCRSAAIFLETEGELAVAGSLGPVQEQLSSLALTKLQEPLVEEARQLRAPRLSTPDHRRGSRIFLGEESAMAAPLEELGVVYVGSDEPDGYDPEHLRLLAILAAQASLALRVTQRLEEERRARETHEQAHLRLAFQAGGMARLLDGLTDLIARLDPQATMDQLSAMVEDLVPHEFQLVQTTRQAGDLFRWKTGEGRRVDEEALCVLATAILANRRPLLIDDLSETRFLAPVEGLCSILGAPILVEGEPLGVLLLGSSRRAAFERQHQDLLSLLGFQAGVALKSARNHQELEVAHRDLKQSQAQLVQSSKMASVGQLAAGIAHELNSPLGAVLVRLDSAGRILEREPRKALERLDKARDAALKARDIVARLLHYSRATSGVRQDLPLDPVVRETLQVVGHQMALDQVQVHLDLEETPPVSLDQNEMLQVLSNLLLNARDACLEPGAAAREIRIATRSDGGRVYLEVQDRGAGMDAEVCSRIFEPFFTTKDVGRGTGLGLSVSYEIVKRHGGDLEVRSEPGVGSVFVLSLPKAEVEQPA